MVLLGLLRLQLLHGIIMADLARDIRLAVDTGKVVLGTREVMRSVSGNSAKLIVVAANGEKDAVRDILHECSVAGIKAVKIEGSSVELGTLCGKPYPVSAIAVIDEGHSSILED